MSDLRSETTAHGIPEPLQFVPQNVSLPATLPLEKQLVDLCLAALLILLLAIPLLIVMTLIKLDSPGPVFFRQPRIGLNNRIFLIWKFRTMRADVGDLGGTRLTERNDPRITRIGAWLRKRSVDELPQLFNVLAGDMSLVGPRPHPISAKAGGRLYGEVVSGYNRRHSVKPGITGWAQVNGWRGETNTEYQIEQRVAYDMEYIERSSLRLDLWIMVLTVLREVRSRNAF